MPADKKIRVLAGEPPFDWSTVTSASQIPYRQRDPYPASLAKGRRVLLIYGGMHLLRRPPGSGRTITTLIEQKTGIRAYVIVPLRPLTTDPGGVFPRLAAYPAAPSSRPRAAGSGKSAPETSCPARWHR